MEDWRNEINGEKIKESIREKISKTRVIVLSFQFVEGARYRSSKSESSDLAIYSESSNRVNLEYALCFPCNIILYVPPRLAFT